MTDRAHLYRVITDNQGNVYTATLTVSVFQPGTTTLISDLLYTDNTGSTGLTNPFTITNGIVDFYLVTPQRVDLKVDDGATSILYQGVDVLEVATGGGFDPNADPVVIGSSANANSVVGAVAIGSGATAASSTDNDGTIAIGYGASSDDGTVVGSGAYADSNGTAIGAGASASHNGGTTKQPGESPVALGSGAAAQGNSAAALGGDCVATGSRALAVGSNANATANNTIAIGGGNASAVGAIAIGTTTSFSGSYSYGTNAIAIGVDSQSEQTDAIAIGHQADAAHANAVALGSGTNAAGDNAIAIGDGSYATAASATAMGQTAHAVSAYGVAIGYQANAGGLAGAGVRGVAIGYNANTEGDFSTAIGNAATATHSQATALGNNATTTADNQIMMGTASETVQVPGKLSLVRSTLTAYTLYTTASITLAPNTPTWVVFTDCQNVDEASASQSAPVTAPFSDGLVSFDGTNPEVTCHATGLWAWAVNVNVSTATSDHVDNYFKIYGNQPARTLGSHMFIVKDPSGLGGTATLSGCDWVNSWFGSPTFTVSVNLEWKGASNITFSPSLELTKLA